MFQNKNSLPQNIANYLLDILWNISYHKSKKMKCFIRSDENIGKDVPV